MQNSVLTDACYSSTLQCVGVFLAVLRAHGPLRYYFAAARIPQWLLDAFAAFVQRMTYICQAELLAYLCAYLTFPDLLEGHLIHHFGDNMAAISGVVKGGSSLPDSARLIHAIHLQVLRLRCYPWFGFVYSEDNVADLPSRLDFVLMRRIGAVERRCVFPTELDWASPARFLTG